MILLYNFIVNIQIILHCKDHKSGNSTIIFNENSKKRRCIGLVISILNIFFISISEHCILSTFPVYLLTKISSFMKKYLLPLFLVMLSVGIINAQNQGYHWTFGSAPPFVSTPATTGSTGSHTLTLLGDGAPGITVVNEAVGLGTSCTGPINVGTYHQPPDYFYFGLQFNNAPQFVTNVYTIEMTVKFAAATDYHRLIGFNDLSDPDLASPSDDGIYITPDPPDPPGDNGQIVFRIGGVNNYFGSPTIAPNTWYHLAFVRDASDVITLYVNGVFQNNFADAGDNFVPKLSNGNAISFFKDNGTEEDPGSIAKLSIYDRDLTALEITKTFNNVCNTNMALNEGHQWTFPASTPPFNSVSALAGSTGTYTLASILDPITTGTTDAVGIGTSCTAPVDNIAEYPVNAGLDFQNTPRYIYDTYTLELAINFDVLGGGSKKILSFYDLSISPEFTYGIYVNAIGQIDFVNGAGSNVIAAAPLTVNTWYHLVFVRAATGVISYYRNGVLIGTFDDSVNDDFIPQSANGNFITFFKDNDGPEETSGKIAKIGIFNVPLLLTDVQERFNNICNANLVILPVSLKSFTAVKAEKEVQLTWTTASEQNNLGFEVQRSSDGTNFTAIGFVNGNGTTTQESTYHFTDMSPFAGKNYYRLKQVDIDNRASYSSIRIIEMDKDQQRIQLFPNPSRSLITITNIKAGNQMSVFNSQGNLILRKIASSGQESISVEKFAAGVYLLQVTDSDNNKRTVRFSKF